ncbi:hypothetical protein DFH06DRAFT_1171761 [Mycena polygramma]|nr:hypothetical protein DFH06DRAFT_1171761 [Mycena polygramma]
MRRTQRVVGLPKLRLPVTRGLSVTVTSLLSHYIRIPRAVLAIRRRRRSVPVVVLGEVQPRPIILNIIVPGQRRHRRLQRLQRGAGWPEVVRALPGALSLRAVHGKVGRRVAPGVLSVLELPVSTGSAGVFFPRGCGLERRVDQTRRKRGVPRAC